MALPSPSGLTVPCPDRTASIAASSLGSTERAAAEVDLEAVVNEARDFPGFCDVRFWIESLWQIAAELIGSNLRLRIFARAFRIFPREFGVHSVNESELPVAPNMIVVGVGV